MTKNSKERHHCRFSAKSFLQARILCDLIKIDVNEMPIFIDCGKNLEKISCPECGAELNFEWWGTAMSKVAEDKFASMETKMPCCKKTVSLNDLSYYFPCGFASSSIHIFNPAQPIDDKAAADVENILGIGVRIV